MNSALRTAGCPAAERNILTKPTGGASPVSTSVGVDSPLAQPRQQGRAVPLNRRRKVRDDFLGREGRPSQSPSRKGRRQTLNTCLVQPAWGRLVRPTGEVDARLLNESLAPVSSTMSFTKNWIHSVPSGLRPLDFGDHIEVSRRTCPRRCTRRAKHRERSRPILSALPWLRRRKKCINSALAGQ